MAEIIVILFEIQRDKAVQSYTNLSRSYAMFVPQLNKAPKKGCKYMYADPLEGLPHRLVMHDVIATLHISHLEGQSCTKKNKLSRNCARLAQKQSEWILIG